MTTRPMVGWCGNDLEPRQYLSPEPLLQSPDWVASQLRSGQQVPSYSYAGNNPVGNVDPNGLETLILYGNPAFRGTTGFSRASYEAALVSHFFPFSGETDPSRVVAVSAESGFPTRSISNSPAGRPWEHVIYVGHGGPGSLNPSDISVGPETFAGWFGGRSPGRVSLSGCFAGAPDAPFVTRARQLLPFSSFAGVNGSLGVSVRPTWQGQFGGFLSLTPSFPNVVYPSWANANGWYR